MSAPSLLTDVQTIEVSLVRRAANGRRYAVAKGATVLDTAPDTTTATVPAEADTATTATDTAPAGVVVAVSADAAPAPAVAPADAAPAAPSAPAPEPAPCADSSPAPAGAAPVAEPAPEPAPVAKYYMDEGTPLENAMLQGQSMAPEARCALIHAARALVTAKQYLPPDWRKSLDLLCGYAPMPAEAHQEVAKSMPGPSGRAYLDAIAKADSAERELAAARATEAKRRIVAKAAEFSALGPVDILAGIMERVESSAPALSGDIIGLMERANRLAAVAPLLSEVGKSEPAAAAGSAWERIERAAAGIMARDGIAKPEAVAKAMHENPRLYADHEAERRA
jgi:hypothetical protein